jgi:hypothetical protein
MAVSHIAIVRHKRDVDGLVSLPSDASVGTGDAEG